MGEPSPGGSRPADRFNHTHVFNMCECGVVSAQQLGRGGGDMAGREAARVQQVNMARFSGEDQATLRRVTDRRAEETSRLTEVQEQVNEIQSEIRALKQMIQDQGGSVEVMEALETKFNELVKENLMEEGKKIELKDAKIRKLNTQLKQIKANQMKTIGGFALWKILSTAVCVLILGVIVSNLVAYVPGL